uniref:Alpha/beta hydrolase n=1 Tax=viral metagenome TaxID=1070528 RepID=A0A6C0HYD5_9ZZZZ
MNRSCLRNLSNREQTKTLIVTFGSHNKKFGLLPRFEFVRFLEEHFPDTDRHFYIDDKMDLYHKGIQGISTNIDETVEYLKNEIANYENVIFMGISSGGYAAILLGSLLNINYVLAFIPQTLRMKSNIDEKYRDISPYINETTQYYIYGDASILNSNDFHHISHCERIVENHPNVFLTKKNPFDIKKMRDDGELYSILSNIPRPIDN